MKRISFFLGPVLDPDEELLNELKEFFSEDYLVHDFYSGGHFDCVFAPRSVSMSAAIITLPNRVFVDDQLFLDRDFDQIKLIVDQCTAGPDEDK